METAHAVPQAFIDNFLTGSAGGDLDLPDDLLDVNIGTEIPNTPDLINSVFDMSTTQPQPSTSQLLHHEVHNKCNTFPIYCINNVHHDELGCVTKMKAYFTVGYDYYLCPQCNLKVQGWEEFYRSHRQHAGQFFRGQKNNFRVICPTFHTYCNASQHNDRQQCIAATLKYYQIRNKYACPHCNIIVDTVDLFMEEHSHHAGQFAAEQKNGLLNTIPSVS